MCSYQPISGGVERYYRSVKGMTTLLAENNTALLISGPMLMNRYSAPKYASGCVWHGAKIFAVVLLEIMEICVPSVAAGLGTPLADLCYDKQCDENPSFCSSSPLPPSPSSFLIPYFHRSLLLSLQLSPV